MATSRCGRVGLLAALCVLSYASPLTASFSGAGAVAEAAPSAALDVAMDASYVVQLHSSREGFTPPGTGASAMRTQLMTTEAGQQFECFLPPLDYHSDEDGDQSDEQTESGSDASKEERQETAAFLAFGRAAARKVRPKCVQFVDTTGNWVYEVCPGVLVRKVSLKSEEQPEKADVELEMDVSGSVASRSVGSDRINHEVVDLGAFASDASQPALVYDEFLAPETQDRVQNHRKPLFTQRFVRPDAPKQESLVVQFICSATARDDAVAAVQWRDSNAGREARALLVASRVFCDPQHSDADDNDLFTVRSLLRPLEDAHTCVTRNEGWWTYEFCFGRGLRQYHRDADGRIAVEYSLGKFDPEGNRELERSGAALVSEHIDATHDVSRPAYLELYDGGTFCKEFESHAPRKTKVFYYCSQGGTSHHILAVKETQTCVYTVKVSSPVLCDHPHFLNDEQKSDAQAEVLHCIPVEDQ